MTCSAQYRFLLAPPQHSMPFCGTCRKRGRSGMKGRTRGAPSISSAMIHGERTDWIPRARMILQFRDTQTFEPFDRWGHVRESQGKSPGQLLDEFAHLRSGNLGELRALNLRPEDLDRRGRHPALGIVSLSELLAAWAAHDLTHLHQVSRVMAHQYREAVGPWTRFLGVMQCAGHSSPK